MKRSIRLPVSLLLLIAIAASLTLRPAVRGGSPPGYAAPLPVTLPGLLLTPSAALNATLLRLASAEVGEAELRRDVEQLVEGSFAGADGGVRARYRSISLWRRGGHVEVRPESRFQAVRLRSPREYRAFPEFRRALRDWVRRRRFLPGVMRELVGLVKRPIDRHVGRQDFVGPYSSCAVVGNSGILLKSDRGEMIDGHDLVIRLNNARTHGYHRNVGSKTSLSFVNSNILHLCARREKCFCHPYGETVPMIMYICQPVHFLDYALCNSSHKAPLLITDPRFDLLCARIVKYYSLKHFVEASGKPPEDWVKTHDEKVFHYSSGFQAVMLAVGICEQVSVFGFGKSTEANHHYHTNQKAELDLHDYAAEYAFYRDLMERPEVIPFLNDSGLKVPPVVFYY